MTDLNIVILLLIAISSAGISYFWAIRSSRQNQVDLQIAQKELCKLKSDYAQAIEVTEQIQSNSRDFELKATQLTTELSSVNEIVNFLRIEKDKAIASLDKSNTSVSEIKISLTNANTELEKTKNDLSDLQKKNANIEDSLQRTMGERNEHKESCVELKTKLEAKKELLKQQVEALNDSKKKVEKLSLELSENQKKYSQLQSQLSHTETRLNTTTHQLEELKVENKSNLSFQDGLIKERNMANQKNASLSQELTSKEQHFKEQLALLKDSKAELKKEFENLANEILERKGNAFKQLNSESMSKILYPIHEELKGFKNKVEDIHGKETEQRVALRTELENLQKLNKEITDQADKLTTALQGQKKVQGNWGELMLENVLDNAGLRIGKDYEREVNFNTEEGRLRPDVLVHLPQGKHLIIDAKTSLNAYTRFVNSEDLDEQKLSLSEHCQAIRARLNELADKDYWNLPGINSPEIVIMFIPIESAYVEALKSDEALFQIALEKNILIATPTTLLTSLNIVRQLWQFEEQNKHTAELANRAQKFYDKLNTFLVSMEKVGGQLDKAKSTYENAFSQLYTGRANLIKQASEFKELGVSVKKSLPGNLVDKANLELGRTALEFPAIA